MKPKRNKWITVIAVWALSALALTINERHGWVNNVLVTTDMLIIVAVSIYVVVNWVRHGFDSGSYHGINSGGLAWLRRFAFDEEARGGEARTK